MDDDMKEKLKENFSAQQTWIRGFFILVFAFIYWIVKFVILGIVVFQFLSSLITGSPNTQLLTFGRRLSSYAYQILLFLTYNSDTKPYPFGDWPDEG